MATHQHHADHYAVEMLSISKRFGRFVANKDVTLRVRRGEIHALLGENGAGKSTLMNMLYGLLKPDSGSIRVNGSEVRFDSPQAAKAAGIGMVHQHYMLVPTLTPLQNIILGDRAKFVLSERHLEQVRGQLKDLIVKYGLTVRLDVPIWQLSVGEQQRVEILRALYHQSTILILDEPTAMLTPKEVEQLLPRLKALAAEGTSIIIISHHLHDVLTIADNVTVLRAGENAGTLQAADTDARSLARMMVGHVADFQRPADNRIARATSGEAPQMRLVAEGLSAEGDHGQNALEDVSFELGAGEIVAIAGVSGNGQTELEEVLFGLRESTTGRLMLSGADIIRTDPGQRAKAGMAYIPSDRYRYGLVRDMAVSSNLVVDRFREKPFAHRWRLSLDTIQSHARDLIGRFAIKVKSPQQPAGTLSGGNAQRVVLARTLSRDITTLVAAQPARGLDVGAVSFVWEKLSAARDNGVAILLISTELDEVFALADRCYVIYRGKLIGHWHRNEFDREAVGLAMGGMPHANQSSNTAALGAVHVH
ncbi:ABC transporter ATP-binding protein [Aminobacter aganoensis]|uniref:Simple sugar transport system ATP-binding protein n=1 Tax=Aminobacter aganoensis TaxID=83264 RepID=A0A7X0FDA8_9HYPH|nr:ABC transporter ATP-binding protein [Aminobacter aganoensis]MBB6357259.1 simple sugar transport system ATP-binding protein [Aminobacter aganoensis]